MISAVIDYLARMADRGPGGLLRDGADLLITYYLIYRAVLVLRGTRAMQVGVGLGLLLILYGVARYVELTTVSAMLGAVLPSAILIVVVIFQEDIRRGLMRFGSRAWLGSGRSQESRVIDQVIEATTELARHRTGAIITFEQDANLDEFVGSHRGIDLDAAVSSQLLTALFVPDANNPLHDGAVIIRNLRIAKAGVFFPMPQSRMVDESFGSRHRAALGITEETDAVVVVVSEERGSISFCFNGNFVSNLDGVGLRAALAGVFARKARPKTNSGGRRFLSSLAGSRRPAPRAEGAAISAKPHSSPPPPTPPLRKAPSKSGSTPPSPPSTADQPGGEVR